MSLTQLSTTFFLQMFVILVTCHLVGGLARRLGQPSVVGQMIAGVALGPTLFGQLAPQVQQLVFPAQSLQLLYVGAQLGVGAYMFLVGLELRPDLLHKRVRSAAAVSLAGVTVPMLLGAGLALWLVDIPGLFSPKARPAEAALFLGACVSITAFPMLARIVSERGLSEKPLGVLVLSAGAMDDAIAWCVLAIVLATFSSDLSIAVVTIAGGLGYAFFMVRFAPHLLGRFLSTGDADGTSSGGTIVRALVLLMLCCWLMDAAGVHAAFGGFLLGYACPKGETARRLKAGLEPFVATFLLPMFFTFSGLNTKLDLTSGSTMPLVLLAVLVVSFVGKGGACWLAARLAGERNDTALAVGALMNSRGLMELIIAGIGLQRGVIEQPLYSALVLMAVITTLATTPILNRVYRRDGAPRMEPGDPAPSS